MIDAQRRSVLVHRQFVGAGGKTQWRRVQRRVGLDHGRVVEGPVVRHDVARVRRLVAEAAGRVDGAQHAHEHRQRAHRLEPVGMRRQPAHGVEGHRPPLGGGVPLPPRIGPRNGKFEGLVQRRLPHFARQLADALGRDASDVLCPLGRGVGNAVSQQLEGWRHTRPVRQLVVALQRQLAPFLHAFRIGLHHPAAGQVPCQLVVRVAAVAGRAGGGIEGEQAFALALVQHHQLRRIGEPLQEGPVDQALREQFVQQRHEQCAVGAGADRNPLVGDRRIAGAHGVDRDEAAALALEVAQGDLHRVAVVVFRGAYHHEQLGAIQVRAAELPEAAADRIDHAGSHVHRTEAAVRRIVRCAELAREQAGEGLHLVAPGEQGELLRIGGADTAQALGEQLVGALPGDRLELTLAPLAAWPAQKRLRQARRRYLLHDSRAALGADHALVDRVVGIAVDVPDLPVAQVHAYAAAAGTHVARSRLDLGVRGAARGCIVHRLAGEELEHKLMLDSAQIRVPHNSGRSESENRSETEAHAAPAGGVRGGGARRHDAGRG